MPYKEEQENRHILSLIVDNESGVLGRVVGVFSGRGYNIQSLTVSEVDAEKGLSRITITTHAPKHVIEHVITLLEKLIPVHKVENLAVTGPFVERGLVLVKVSAKGKKREEIVHLASGFNAKEVDATAESFVFELADIPGKLDEFIALMAPYHIIELARTGITAISRGKKAL